jgi:hypothetical protein
MTLSTLQFAIVICQFAIRPGSHALRAARLQIANCELQITN